MNKRPEKGTNLANFPGDYLTSPFLRAWLMTAMEEKRRFNRFDFQNVIHVFPVLPSKSGNIFEVQKESFEASASNISEGGLKFETKKELSPNFLLKLNFELTHDQPLEVYGKVIWSKDNRFGIRFMYTDQTLRQAVRSIARGRFTPKN